MGNTNCLKVKFRSRVHVCDSDIKEVAATSLRSEFGLSAVPGKYLLTETKATCYEPAISTHSPVICMGTSVL